MRHVRRLRGMLALFAFVLTLFMVGTADLYGNLAWSTCRREALSDRRKRVARWQSRWSSCWLWCCRFIGGLRIRFVIDRSMHDGRGPFIVISNHFGAIDGLLIHGSLQRFGHHDYRAVAKGATRHVPVMGRAWAEMGVAFVQRDRRKSDSDAVTELAHVAREDEANIIIFPEGTVLTKATAVNGGKTLLPLKFGGWRRLVRALPDYDVLSLTFHWRSFEPYRLSDEGAVPPGDELTVECRVLPAPPKGADDATLNALLQAEWDRKAAWLASQP